MGVLGQSLLVAMSYEPESNICRRLYWSNYGTAKFLFQHGCCRWRDIVIKCFFC